MASNKIEVEHCYDKIVAWFRQAERCQNSQYRGGITDEKREAI